MPKEYLDVKTSAFYTELTRSWRNRENVTDQKLSVENTI